MVCLGLSQPENIRSPGVGDRENWASLWMLGTEPGTSGKAGAISLVPLKMIFRSFFFPHKLPLFVPNYIGSQDRQDGRVVNDLGNLVIYINCKGSVTKENYITLRLHLKAQ